MSDGASNLAVRGSAIVYRLHDVGYAIDLVRAGELLAPARPVRTRPERGEAQAIQIKNPPLDVHIGESRLVLDGVTLPVTLSARLFDFGVVALRANVAVEAGTLWEDFGRVGVAADSLPELVRTMEQTLADLVEKVRPAIDRFAIAPVVEAYVVYRVTTLTHADGSPVAEGEPSDEHLVSLLLNEKQELSQGARKDLLSYRLSYYANELTVLTWDNALIIDPRQNDHDVEYILEFANAQLLELRYYDEVLDRDLPRMNERVARARRVRFYPISRRFSPLLADMQTRVADITETVERIDNAFKVTEDVYLARVYAAALRLFNEEGWRAGMDRKLAIVRETYAMLNSEAQAARSELLELTIVVLIVVEIILGLTVHS